MPLHHDCAGDRQPEQPGGDSRAGQGEQQSQQHDDKYKHVAQKAGGLRSQKHFADESLMTGMQIHVAEQLCGRDGYCDSRRVLQLKDERFLFCMY